MWDTRIVLEVYIVEELTRPQLLEGLKYESQIENNKKGRSRDMLPNS
jgi:hypothetical protein